MIRLARTDDHADIRAIVAAAFGQEDEAELIDRLRADGDVVFELVAEFEGDLQGHILFSRLWAESSNLYAALAPLSVRPDRQRSGLGKRLTEAALETAREFGVHAVAVVGHPSYYPRFGFSASAAQNLRCPFSGDPAFLALELEPGALQRSLFVAYPDAFRL